MLQHQSIMVTTLAILDTLTLVSLPTLLKWVAFATVVTLAKAVGDHLLEIFNARSLRFRKISFQLLASRYVRPIVMSDAWCCARVWESLPGQRGGLVEERTVIMSVVYICSMCACMLDNIMLHLCSIRNIFLLNKKYICWMCASLFQKKL